MLNLALMSNSMKELINFKTLIAVMVVGFIALLPMAEQASSNDKQFHQRCNTAWENSPVANEQGCRAHKINYDHISQGGIYLMCFFDVYCHDGTPHIKGGYRKGVAKEADLRQFRRCKDSPGTINTSCTALEYPFYATCSAEFSLSSAAATCRLNSAKRNDEDCNLVAVCQTEWGSWARYRWLGKYSVVRKLINCSGVMTTWC